MGISNTLGLLFEMNGDPSKALAAMAQLDAASVASSTKVSSLWSDAMKTISGPTGIALGLFAGLGGAALEMANKAAEAGNQIYEASEKTGMSAQALSGVLAISKETGKSFESVASAFARGERAIAQAADTGKGALTSLFSEAQLQALKLKPVDEQMQTVLHSIFALSNEGERNRQLQALLGRGWMENVSVLKLLATEGYGPAIDQAKKLNIFFDEKAAREAHQYQIEMHQLAAEIAGLGVAVGRQLVPHIAEWLAQLHTVDYEVKLLEIGLKAQALSMLNVGGIFNKQLDDLAKQATDVFTAEHEALLKYKADIASLAEGAAAGPEGGPLGAPPRGGKSGAAQQAEDTSQLAASYGKLKIVLPPVIEEMQRIEKSKADEAIKKQALALLDYGKNFQPLASGPLSLPQYNANLLSNLGILQQLPPYTEKAAGSVHKLSTAHAEAIAFQYQWNQAIKASIAAVQADLVGSTEALTVGLAKLVGGRKAQAAVEALWETAKGIACLAEGTWPPNPAAIIAAGLHFEAAAEYATMAGKSAGRHGTAGAGAGGGRSEYERGEYGGGGWAAGREGVAASGLAPGAQGSIGGRLNVIVIGEAETARFFAGQVNAADQAGHFMQVSSARRSAPAQG